MEKIDRKHINDLSYFDFKAFMGQNSLHPYGLESTHKLFKNLSNFIDIENDCKILEIGCGAGGSTIPLLKSGFNLTSCDINEEMVNRTEQEAINNGFLFFKPYLTDAANLFFSKNLQFDIVLTEAVLFFIKELDQAISEINRVLKAGGYFCTIDMFYKKPPCEEIKDNMRKIFGKHLNFFTLEEWKNKFINQFDLIYFEHHDLDKSYLMDNETISDMVVNLHKLDNIELINLICQKHNYYESIFIENRKHLEYYIAIWRKK